MTMHAVDLIRKTRDGHLLSPPEIEFLVQGAARHTIPDAQLAAWLMAAFLRGLAPAELQSLTQSMRFSGEVFNTSSLGKTAVDKHSTGGVGDKTSFLVAPIAAAAGLAVPMISGRALGHTGGTLDKLESIPGYRTQLPLDEMRRVIQQCGASIVGQTQNLVPADRVLYALRDHVGAVESPDLICASIMSKKLAAGLNALVLDVKTGSGAFLKRREDALHLASLMVETGESAGTRTVALLTSMDQPLGRMAGNWIEIQESIELLQNQRHPLNEDLREISLILAGWMLHLAGKAETPEAGFQTAEELVVTGAAWRTFECMIRAHGGDLNVVHSPKHRKNFLAERDGWLTSMDCESVGFAVQRLGAGRSVPGEPVAAHAGIEMYAKIGSRIERKQPVCTMYAEDEALFGQPEELLRRAILIGDEPSAPPQLVQQVVTVENAMQFRLASRKLAQ